MKTKTTEESLIIPERFIEWVQTPAYSTFQKLYAKSTGTISKGTYKLKIGKITDPIYKKIKFFFSIQKPSFFGQYNKYYIYMNIGLFICCLFSGVGLVYVGTIKFMMDRGN